jgi:hypothetical protein
VELRLADLKLPQVLKHAHTFFFTNTVLHRIQHKCVQNKKIHFKKRPFLFCDRAVHCVQYFAEISGLIVKICRLQFATGTRIVIAIGLIWR